MTGLRLLIAQVLLGLALVTMCMPAWAGSIRANLHVSVRVVDRCAITFPDGDRRQFVRPGETFPVPRIDCRLDNRAQLETHLVRLGDQADLEIVPILPDSPRDRQNPAAANELRRASDLALVSAQDPSAQLDQLIQLIRSVGDADRSFYVVTVIY